jgi:beta-lactamase class A
MPLIQHHKGKVAVAVKSLKTGESFLYNEDVPMPTASLIKFPVMIETYRQAAENRVDLNKMVTLKKADKVPGSGVLTNHFSEGATFPLVDAVHLMIAFSDNTATNLVLDEIGLKSTAETMEKLGYPHTKIHSKVFHRETSVFPERSKQFGLGSTTASDMIRLCEALHNRALVSSEASEAMLKHMRACDDKDKFPRLLPAGTKVAFKTGSVDDVRTAAGIIDCGKGPIAVCVLTRENDDRRYDPDNAGNRLCAQVAREVFDHFRGSGNSVTKRAD